MQENVSKASGPKGRLHVKHAAVLLAVWAVGATVGVVWVAYAESREEQMRAWTYESTILRHFRANFDQVSFAADRLLATGDHTWGMEADYLLLDIYIIWLQSPAIDGRTFRILGFTLPHLRIASGAISHVAWDFNLGSGVDDLSRQVEYLSQVKELYDSVSDMLRDVEPNGTDPLAQLGPEKVNSVAETMSAICELSSEWEPFGGCD